MGYGYVKLNRQIQGCWVWKDKPYAMGQAWVDLIMLANHEDGKEFRDGKLHVYKRGTVNRSIQSLSERWGWNRKKTRRFLDALESDGMVTVNSTTHGTTIALINYEVFNGRGTTDGTTEGQPKDNHGTTEGQPWDINKKEKKEKNDKELKEKIKKKFIPPTREEVVEFVRQNNLSVDPNAFYDYFSDTNWIDSKGNKVLSWKGKLRTWSKFETPKKQQQEMIEGHLRDDLDEIERLLTKRKE